ncbi:MULTISPECIES: NAD(P)H-dependent oxidoreductase [Microbulbifer]|uniref:NAD(P)H-dependent oxidoreductase n=1 Tax=Microbulbifer TaxID=48073 RepID=UPI001E433F30|nr:NAD(P)H-dependent oxidoreductase [Microbulbifer sp. YPW16]UHQ54447.1 NAD(P)H-dependent oxidoreductase [Microbulbifer sp. YPW16]
MNLFIINTHQYYPFSEGKLSAAMVAIAREEAEAAGHAVKVTTMQDAYDVEAELEKHEWADVILLQVPVNWMGVPWSFKKYMDEVYTAGMSGRLCDGDGRHRDQPERQYGTGGVLGDKRYMLSLTFNAPAEAFGDGNQFLFKGRDVDDLFMPTHMNFRFFNMSPLETFVCYDVMKNPETESDKLRFREHLRKQLNLGSATRESGAA